MLRSTKKDLTVLYGRTDVQTDGLTLNVKKLRFLKEYTLPTSEDLTTPPFCSTAFIVNMNRAPEKY